MRLMRVTGPLWGARHAPGLDGAKVLEGVTPGGSRVVAIDQLGAGPGEWVLVAHGSRVRDLTVGPLVADKDIVVAIVDDADPSSSLALIEPAGQGPGPGIDPGPGPGPRIDPEDSR